MSNGPFVFGGTGACMENPNGPGHDSEQSRDGDDIIRTCRHCGKVTRRITPGDPSWQPPRN